MKIVFLGDINVERHYDISLYSTEVFNKADVVLANLEGPILKPEIIDSVKSKNISGVYNSIDVILILKNLKISAVWLANNHMFDFADNYFFTEEYLKREGINYFGAGADIYKAGSPLSIEKDDISV